MSWRGAVSWLLLLAARGATYPRRNIHDGDNRIQWTPGCCDGDLVVLDFRDEQSDGNDGSGMLYLSNSSSGLVNQYALECVAFSPPCC